MARLTSMVRDRKTGRSRRKDPKRVKAGKAAARKRGHKKLSAATKKKIAKGVRKAARTGKTSGGRRVVNARRGGGGRSGAAKRGRGKPGRKPGFRHSEATIKKMKKAHKARWKLHGARYRKAHATRRNARRKYPSAARRGRR